MIREICHAKINLSLDVIKRRENGYHDVSMVMKTIDLADEVILEKIDEDKVIFSMDGVTSTSIMDEAAEDNLAVKAYRLLKDKFPEQVGGISIKLTKNIPVAAGLAGGSADAAGVLRGVNRLYELGLSTEELMDMSVALGADIPFCVMEGCALSEGIGEILTPLDDKCFEDIRFEVVKPDADVNTGWAYGQIDKLLENNTAQHPDVSAQVRSINSGDLDGVIANMGNTFEQVIVPIVPQINEIKEDMISRGAIATMMSGSGPSVYGLFRK